VAGGKLRGELFGGCSLEVAIGIVVIRHAYLFQLFRRGVWQLALHRVRVLDSRAYLLVHMGLWDDLTVVVDGRGWIMMMDDEIFYGPWNDK